MKVDIKYEEPPGLYTFTCSDAIVESYFVLEGSDYTEERQVEMLWDWMKRAMRCNERFAEEVVENGVGFGE